MLKLSICLFVSNLIINIGDKKMNISVPLNEQRGNVNFGYESVEFISYASRIGMEKLRQKKSELYKIDVKQMSWKKYLHRIAASDKSQAFIKWCLTFIIGFLTAYIAIIITLSSKTLSEWKFAIWNEVIGKLIKSAVKTSFHINLSK